MSLLARAIRSIRPGAKWSLVGDDPVDLEWFDETISKPSLGEIMAAVGSIQAIDELEAYKAERRGAYVAAGLVPEVLVVALWERIIEGNPVPSDQIQAIRQRIKAEIPNPNEPREPDGIGEPDTNPDPHPGGGRGTGR